MTRRDSFSDPDLHDLAGQYVLGTLPAAERRHVEDRMRHDAALEAAVQAWEERLLPLTQLAEPVPPSDRLWRRIDRSVTAEQASAMHAADGRRPSVREAKPPKRQRPGVIGWWNSLAAWRALAAGLLAATAMLASVLVWRLDAPSPAPQFMVVLVAPDDKAPGWVIQADMPQQLRLIPLGRMIVPQDKALQFWTKGAGWDAPVSLGLVKPSEPVRIPLDKLPPLQPEQLFELTLEPSTGSPTGRPTGPIQFIGRAVKVS